MEPPDTQPFMPSSHSPPAPPAPAAPKPAPDLPKTVATVSLPPQTNAAADDTKSTGHFVHVSREELGKDHIEEAKPAIISWQTWALAAGLLLVGFTVWYFLRPPNADSLYRRIAARTQDEKIESIIQAEDDIREFLEVYPGGLYSGDPRASKLRKYQREIELDRLQRRFDLLDRGLVPAENLLPVERAISKPWATSTSAPNSAIAKLQALLNLYQNSSETAGPTGDCLTLARRRLEQLKSSIERFAPEQLDVIQKQLDQADGLLPADPKRAQAMYRAAIELYSDKPWAAPAVRRAQAALDKVKTDQ